MLEDVVLREIGALTRTIHAIIEEENRLTRQCYERFGKAQQRFKAGLLGL